MSDQSGNCTDKINAKCSVIIIHTVYLLWYTYTQDCNAYSLLGYAYYWAGDVEEAKQCFERTVSFVDNCVDIQCVYIALADIYLKEKQVCMDQLCVIILLGLVDFIKFNSAIRVFQNELYGIFSTRKWKILHYKQVEYHHLLSAGELLALLVIMWVSEATVL